MLSETAEPFVARATVSALCCAMAAPVLQFAYPESLALALVLLCLWLVRRRRWAWLAVAAVLLSLTRPVVAPLGAALLLAAMRWPGTPAPDPATRRRLVIAGIGVGSLTLVWPAVAALGTGRFDAYFATSKAWTPGLGSLLPGPGYLWNLGGPLGLVLFVIGAALVFAIPMRRGASDWGPELRAWAMAYPLYLLVMTVPGPSHARYLLLTGVWFSPFVKRQPDTAVGVRRIRLIALVALLLIGLALQYQWLRASWRVVGLTP
jgi:hypothetical protein